jgi:hypothetical protein
MEIRKNLLGEVHPDYAFTLSKIGEVYIKKEESV